MLLGNDLFFRPLSTEIKIEGSNTRLVKVAVTRVREVNQPRAFVPSKPLKQKMTKPAISTRDV